MKPGPLLAGGECGGAVKLDKGLVTAMSSWLTELA